MKGKALEKPNCNSLFKAELIRNKGPWKSIEDLEIAVAEWKVIYDNRADEGEDKCEVAVHFACRAGMCRSPFVATLWRADDEKAAAEAGAARSKGRAGVG